MQLESNLQAKTTKVTEVDVLISGAGPVGLALANLLVKQNLSFKIIDKNPSVGDYSRAFVVQSRTLEVLNQLEVLDEICKLGHKTFLRAKGHINGDIVFEAVLPPSKSSIPFTIILPQSEIEKVLEAKLNSLGHSVDRLVELETINYEQDGSAKSGIVKFLETGDKELIKFKYLVGCDGARSLVRKSTGVKFIGESSDLRLLCFDANLKISVPRDTPLSFFYDEYNSGVFLWINDLAGRFILPLSVGEPDLSKTEMIDRTKSLVRKSNLELQAITWINTFRVNECIVERYYKKNVFLCGDAAHTHSPAGGQGMNTGIQDAYNLAWKLSLLVKDIAKDAIIKQSFHDERSKVAERVLQSSALMIRNGLAKPTWFGNFVKRYILPVILSLSWFKNIAVAKLSEVDIEYNNSELIKKNDKGWFFNTVKPYIGLRIDDHPLTSIEGKPVSIHKILVGKDQFELFIYIPSTYFEADQFNSIHKLLIDLINNPSLEKIRNITKTSLYKLSFITNINLFQPDQWAQHLSNVLPKDRLDHITTVKNVLKDHSVYLDQINWASKEYKVSTIQPTALVVRPDAHIGMIHILNNMDSIIDYFGGFIQLS